MSTRPATLLLAAGLVLAVPLVGAQATTRVTSTATPSGGWDADGYVAIGNETPSWKLDIAVEFSNAAFCPEDTFLHLAVRDDVPYAEATVEPRDQTLDVPPGGGTVRGKGDLTVSLTSTAPAVEAILFLVTAAVDACPSPLGTQPAAQANLTLEARPLLRPGLHVELDHVFSYDGRFLVFTRNTGNGPLRLTFTVAALPDAAEQIVALPSPFSLAVGADAVSNLTFPEAKPGNHTLRVEGLFDGPQAANLPKVTRDENVAIYAAPPAPKKDSPPPGLLAVAAALVVALGLRRAQQR